MNTPAIFRILLPLGIMAVLPSCEVAPGQYGGSGYSSGYDSSSNYYSNYSSQPIYGSAGGYYSSGYSRPYYNSSYGGPRYYRDYDRNNYSRYDNHRHSSSSRSSSSSNRSQEEAIRLVKVRDGSGGNVPQGYHSKEYFKNRGISLSKNTYETRDGDRRGYTSSSGNKNSSSGNKDNSSRNNNKSDDKRKGR